MLTSVESFTLMFTISFFYKIFLSKRFVSTVLITCFSSNLQVFQVPGVGLMAAMAHRSTASGSAVYIWSNTGFQLYQNISTYGALAWRHFIMGKKVWQKESNVQWSMNWAQVYAISAWSKEFGELITPVSSHYDLGISSGVQLRWRARQAFKQRIIEGLLCDLQVEQKKETVCAVPDSADSLCKRLGGL